MIKFVVGENYYFTGLYTMGYWCKCVGRTGGNVMMDETGYKDATTQYEIIENETTESILIWSYKGENCHVYADMPDGYNRTK